MAKIKEKCCLCGKKGKEQVHLYVGGCVSFAHESCCKIGKKFLERYDRWKKLMKEIVKNQKLNSQTCMFCGFRKDKHPVYYFKKEGGEIRCNNFTPLPKRESK